MPRSWGDGEELRLTGGSAGRLRPPPFQFLISLAGKLRSWLWPNSHSELMVQQRCDPPPPDQQGLFSHPQEEVSGDRRLVSSTVPLPLPSLSFSDTLQPLYPSGAPLSSPHFSFCPLASPCWGSWEAPGRVTSGSSLAMETTPSHWAPSHIFPSSS